MIDLNPTVSVEAGIELRESIIVAKVKSLLRWVEPSGTPVDYLVQACPGIVFDAQHAGLREATTPNTELDLQPLLPSAAGEKYSFAVSARNAAGNIGDPGLLEDQIVDFTVPGAPTGLEIVFPS